MKVTIVNTSERTGGAAVAAGRLMKALKKAGVTVRMLVRDKKSEDPDVVSVDTFWLIRKINFIRFVWERLIIFLSNRLSRKNLFQVSMANTGTDLCNWPQIWEADVIHLHWINQGFLSLKDIQRLIQTGKPIVWTLHDLWPATGICHYPDQCLRYRSQCEYCPMQVEHPLWDLAQATYNRKLNIDFSRITFVGCSEWITNQACQSRLLENARFLSIPNPIDTTVFKRMDMLEARRRFGLPLKRSLLLFAAAKVSDVRKGAIYLIEACRVLECRKADNFDIVLMGNSSDELIGQFPCKVHTLGYISDSETMAAAYSCADLFVIPSLEDNLPNTIMEAMASGTPCVGFRTGGIPEMIDHKINGYVAHYKDPADLAAGIEWVLEHGKEAGLSEACVRKVASHYSESVVAEQYMTLYKQMICNNPNSQS